MLRELATASMFLLAPAPSETVEYAPGLRMDVDLPEQPATGAVLAVHGGGWWSGSRGRMARTCAEIVVQAGLACFAPDYTLSGVEPFNRANRDLLAAVEFVRARGFADVSGIGASAGGNLVAWLATRGVLRTSVIWSAPMDLTSLADWYRPGCVCWVIEQFAPTARKRRAASPTFHTGTEMGSVLIVHSADEALIPVTQARAFARAIPTPHRLVILPGDRHALDYFDDVAATTIEWLIDRAGP
jgi:acetyl esterase/lipase